MNEIELCRSQMWWSINEENECDKNCKDLPFPSIYRRSESRVFLGLQTFVYGSHRVVVQDAPLICTRKLVSISKKEVVSLCRYGFGKNGNFFDYIELCWVLNSIREWKSCLKDGLFWRKSQITDIYGRYILFVVLRSGRVDCVDRRFQWDWGPNAAFAKWKTPCIAKIHQMARSGTGIGRRNRFTR